MDRNPRVAIADTRLALVECDAEKAVAVEAYRKASAELDGSAYERRN